MSVAQVKAISLLGLVGEVVLVESDISDGLPSYSLLGLPDAALNESRDRVRAAIVNSELNWPNRKVVVSLSPAWLPKSGSSFDLPIALSLLSAQGAIPEEGLQETLFIGELALDGSIRSIRGVLPILIAASRAGIKRAVIPSANIEESSLLTGINSIGMSHLRDVVEWLRNGAPDVARTNVSESKFTHENQADFADVAGQKSARFAAEISAVGGHHLLMIGAPGAGKTMIAQRLPSILPELSTDAAIEVSAMHSIAGGFAQRSPLSLLPPFVAPHHSATRVAIVGGGANVIRPGACSLAHNGVLFIDEAPECDAGILDSLRQPLESGNISISRSIGTVIFPAQFLLVLAANPCPCGKFLGRGRNCTCSSLQVRRYLAKLSGPLMDRIDLKIEVDSISRSEFSAMQSGEASSQIRARVIAARARAAERFAEYSWKLNSQIPSQALRRDFAPERSALNFLHDELDRERITARGLHKIIRVAWSIADLRGGKVPTLEDVQLAHSMREKGRAI